jgi:hypothetical protein
MHGLREFCRKHSPSFALRFAVALGSILIAQGQTAASPAAGAVTPSNIPVPRIVFASTDVEFGRALSGTVLRHEFRFTNTGSATLEITAVRPGCGCTTAGDFDRKVEPGKTSIIPLRLNTAGFSGEITKRATIVSNDPEQPTVGLELKAEVWKPVDIRPSTAVFTLSPDNQTNQTKVLKLVNQLENPITLVGIENTNASFKAELKVIRPGQEFELHITTVTPFASGSTRGVITLKTSSAEAPEIRVTAQATVLPAVTVSPAQLALPSNPTSLVRTNWVTIRSNGARALELSDVRVNGADDATVMVQETQPGRLFRIGIMFPGGFEMKPGEEIALTLRSNHPDYEQIRVPVVRSKVAQRLTAKPIPGRDALPRAP